MNNYRITISIEQIHDDDGQENIEPLKNVFGDFTCNKSRSIAIFERVAAQLLMALKRLKSDQEKPAISRELVTQ